MQQRRAKGSLGEAAAQRFLEERCGYRLVDANVRFGAKSGLIGELDIVAWDGPTLCFVEVKTRAGGAGHRRAGETPAEWVTPAKQRQIARLALAYAAETGLLESGPGEADVPLRFDVAAVYLPADADENSPCSVDLTRGAFSVPEDAFDDF